MAKEMWRPRGLGGCGASVWVSHLEGGLSQIVIIEYCHRITHTVVHTLSIGFVESFLEEHELPFFTMGNECKYVCGRERG